ncbi:hypothetical protein [Chryseobacterium sp. BIGb0232]|uniref:hypothetical protein n=1 Tax=Chryseobacterium sp. BIGb0232 TaxID=2940598 RepID=UPI000F48550A|nr:hypothetical protein [Chryseobacterium sp. BIGb0232]MCS4302304.1 hypothetical protein [Chryseobacterium sp. BIGb0232]ROS18249.1 hypothetical protein EDF65_2641 [Chryseobacterium nakagawai]
MKNFLILILFISISCSRDKKKDLSKTLPEVGVSQVQSKIPDFLSIDESYVGKEILHSAREKLIQTYKKSLERDFERPYMWDALLPDNENLIKIYTYKKYIINNQNFNSYCVKIKYEDASYEAILLTTDNLDTNNSDNSSIIVYENLISEELYKRYSKIDNANILNIVLQKNKKEYNHFQYLISENKFLDYFTNEEKQLNKNWGEHEDNTYEYQIKGNIKNHLKNGHWEEKRYSFEYNKSIWMDGEYNNGIRNKEWNISPEGPVEKINVYNNGIIVKTFTP